MDPVWPACGRCGSNMPNNESYNHTHLRPYVHLLTSIFPISFTMILPRRFPQETFDMFIDNLEGDRESLMKCSLVCRSWVVASQRNLFRLLRVYIDASRSKRSNPVKRLSAVFNHSPHLIKHVRGLHLSMGTPPKRRSQQKIMAKILAKLDRLTTLTLDTLRPSEILYFDVAEPLFQALRKTLASQLVVDITMACWIFQDVSQFLGLLGSTPRPLASLHLSSIDLQTEEPFEDELLDTFQLPATPPVVIETLTIDGCDPLEIINWLCSSDCTIHVKTLFLALDEFAEILIPIINLFALSVEELYITDVTYQRHPSHTDLWDPEDPEEREDLILKPLLNLRTVTITSANPAHMFAFEKLVRLNFIENITITVCDIDDFFAAAMDQQIDSVLGPINDNYPSLKMVTLDFVVDFPTVEDFKNAALWMETLVEWGMLYIQCPDGKVHTSDDILREASGLNTQCYAIRPPISSLLPLSKYVE